MGGWGVDMVTNSYYFPLFLITRNLLLSNVWDGVNCFEENGLVSLSWST